MSTKHGILSLGFIGCLGFVAGLFCYYTAITLHHAASAADEPAHETIVRMQVIISKILLFGGLAVMAISLVGCLLNLKKDTR